MNYVSYDRMATTIRHNLWKIPHDIDLIVGVPRSGMIAALMLAELMNKRVADVEMFLRGKMYECGGRGGLMPQTDIRKVLVIDDTVFRGNAMTHVRERLSTISDMYTILYGCVYTDGPDAKNFVDIYLEDIAGQDGPLLMYEWNIFHHYPDVMEQTMWDIDGLLCKEPPWDSDVKAYEAYLPKALPMVIPTAKVGAIVTYRLEKYREPTEVWLEKQGIAYNYLFMFPDDDAARRNNTISPAVFKSRVYKDAAWANLFYESDGAQARFIAFQTKKPVFSYEDGRVF